MKKRISLIIFIFILLAVIFLTLYKIELKKDTYNTKTFLSMDTSVSVTLWGEQFNDKLYNKIRNHISNLSSTFDSYNENGELFKLNKTRHMSCSPEMIDIISKTLSYQKKYKNVDISSGKLISLWDFQSENPRLPSEEKIFDALKSINYENININDNIINIDSDTKIDLGSSAKGYTCDIIKNDLINSNADCAIVSFGSSALLYGQKPDNDYFSVALKVPKKKSKASIGKLKTKSCVISSSGGYERYFEIDNKTYSHILDLNTGYPAETDLLSVTVISQNGLLTDFLSTEIYIGGTKNIDSYLNNKNYSVIAVSDKNKIYISDRIKNDFKITDNEYSFAK